MALRRNPELQAALAAVAGATVARGQDRILKAGMGL